MLTRLRLVFSRPHWFSLGQACLFALAACGFAYVMWQLAIPSVLRATYQAHFTLTGDYQTDADAALLLGMQGKVWALYSTNPQPLMLPVALLVRLLFLWPAHWLGWVQGQHHFTAAQQAAQVHALDRRYLVGMLGMTATALLVLAYSLRQRLKWSSLLVVVILAAIIIQPLNEQTLLWGHPEEFFGAAMIASGMFFTLRGRWQTGVLLAAVAVATKQTFVLGLPIFLLVIPLKSRRRWWGFSVGLILLLVVPFVASAFGHFFAANQDTGTANGSHSLYQLDVFHAFNITSISSIGHPLLVVLAIALPAVIAWRNGWQLSGLQAAALLVIIYLLRCILDPFNISYYAAPAVTVLFPLEYALWRERRHILQRWAPLATTEYWFPIGATGLGWLIATFNNGLAANFWSSIFGNVEGKDYVLEFFILALLCLPWAVNRRWTFDRSRQRLYGSVLGVLIVFIVIAHFTANTTNNHTQLPAPAGFRNAPLAAIIQSVGQQPIYWLGPQTINGNYLNIQAEATPLPHHAPNIRLSFFDYGTYTGVRTVGVFSFKATRASREAFQKKLVQCSGFKPCPHTTIETTQFGRALITDITSVKAPSQIIIQFITQQSGAYIISDANVSVGQILARLQRVPPSCLTDASACLPSLK